MTEGKTHERDIDIVIQQVCQRMPEVKVFQWPVKRPTDDDSLWWFDLPEVKWNIQIEGYFCPFLVETDEQCCGEALKARTIDEAVEMIVSYLQSVKTGYPAHLTGELYWSK